MAFIAIASLLALFLTVELAFLIANLQKFAHGGWITLMIASGLSLLSGRGMKHERSVTALLSSLN